MTNSHMHLLNTKCIKIITTVAARVFEIIYFELFQTIDKNTEYLQRLNL